MLICAAAAVAVLTGGLATGVFGHTVTVKVDSFADPDDPRPITDFLRDKGKEASGNTGDFCIDTDEM